MLKKLTISNYALIELIEIEFPKNLIIITGETGAGKSIILGALSLLSGNKVDKSIFRDGDKNCVVEAIFDLYNTNSTEEIILRRVINSSGKSRSFINDEPVSSQQLRDRTTELFDIHEQQQHLLLSDHNFQLSALDSFCNNNSLLQKYKHEYATLQELNSEKNRLKEKREKEERELDFNRFQHSRLEEAKIDAIEFASLEQEYNILSNAEEIRSTLYNITSLLAPEGISLAQNLKTAKNQIDKIQTLEKAKEIGERLESCKIEIEDLENELLYLADKITLSPERLIFIEERISMINTLLKQHHVTSIEDLITIREDLKEKISSSDDTIEKLSNIEKLYNNQLNIVQQRAAELSKIRISMSSDFDKELTKKIRDLEMPDAKFITIVEEQPNLSPLGINTIKFLFSANRNIAPVDLSKVASGGELSRIMLCLKMIISLNNSMPTMIFDEIDTGVSGKIADKMGLLIEQMSHTMQIIAITHLPQIASKGGFHLLVYKEINDQECSESKIKEIRSSARVHEIARMLSGAKITEAALANAKELLTGNE